ncbi:DICT sensory domain-containing protein [Salarchaeum japonicum]|uniref:DICT sensory domain-containing protein n=1 Tax=Salarchaeum japonicum TaxID=555573 RepID=A0AAV3T235_9EURY|nr:DICT sensory domain-containing protein [Salarchaeum japonicum]
MDSIRSLVGRVESEGRTLTVYDPLDESVVDRLRDYFGPQRVTVTVAESRGEHAPANFAVLHEAGDVVAASDLDDVDSVIAFEAGIVSNPDFERDSYPAVLEHDDTTTFTSFDKRSMIIASREVEVAAYNVGRGELRVGFQSLSKMDDQWSVYTQLARSGLDVHVYGLPDWERPQRELDLTFHTDDVREVRESWFVVYDGDGRDSRKLALIASERDDGTFHGFWTYDASIVDEFLDYVHAGGLGA